MAEFTVEIAGDQRDQLAHELKDSLIAHQGQVQIFSETERAIDPITVVSVVLTALQAADIVWKWWQNSRKSASKVTIRTASGRVIELSNVDQKQIEQLLEEED